MTKLNKMNFSILILAISFGAVGAQASSPKECKDKVAAARASLVELMGGKKDQAQQSLVSSTAQSADECLMKLAVKGKEKDVQDLVKVWKEFKTTRETELVPKILAGKDAEAKALGTGIQKERVDKMMALFSKIEGGDL